MNGAHWHLVLNHLPIIIPMVGLLIMIGGLMMKSELLKRAAYSIFILGAIAAIAAFLASGDATYITGQTIYADGGRLGLAYTVDVPEG